MDKNLVEKNVFIIRCLSFTQKSIGPISLAVNDYNSRLTCPKLEQAVLMFPGIISHACIPCIYTVSPHCDVMTWKQFLNCCSFVWRIYWSLMHSSLKGLVVRQIFKNTILHVLPILCCDVVEMNKIKSMKKEITWLLGKNKPSRSENNADKK